MSNENDHELDEFTLAYIEAALWSSTDDSIEPGGPSHPDSNGGDPLDKNYSIDDLAPSCLLAMKRDCAAFQKENEKDLSEARYGKAQWSDASMQGHDFWFTAAGHGAGFWDGDLPKELGERLTEASKKFSTEFGGLYVGDDGMIYLAGRENES